MDQPFEHYLQSALQKMLCSLVWHGFFHIDPGEIESPTFEYKQA